MLQAWDSLYFSMSPLPGEWSWQQTPALGSFEGERALF